MIDETKIIKRLENRIDTFVEAHPKENHSPAVETIREFIHMLKEEAKEQTKEKAGGI